MADAWLVFLMVPLQTSDKVPVLLFPLKGSVKHSRDSALREMLVCRGLRFLERAVGRGRDVDVVTKQLLHFIWFLYYSLPVKMS